MAAAAEGVIPTFNGLPWTKRDSVEPPLTLKNPSESPLAWLPTSGEEDMYLDWSEPMSSGESDLVDALEPLGNGLMKALWELEDKRALPNAGEALALALVSLIALMMRCGYEPHAFFHRAYDSIVWELPEQWAERPRP